jgi:hypothetical protein
MNDQMVNVERGTKKKIFFQFATIFHHLKQGRLMTNYECM